MKPEVPRVVLQAGLIAGAAAADVAMVALRALDPIDTGIPLGTASSALVAVVGHARRRDVAAHRAALADAVLPPARW
jgi:hypothetical protein